MRRLSIKIRLILTLSVILVVSFVATSVANYVITRDNVRKEILTSDLPLTSSNLYSEIVADLMLPISISSLMANDTFLRDWAQGGERNLESIIKYLHRIQGKYEFFSSFFVSSQTGNYYHYRGVLKKISPKDEHDIWYYNFIESKEEYYLDVDVNQAENNRLTIFINFRLEGDEGQLLGVTGVGIEMGEFAELLGSYQQKYNRTIYLTDSAGVVQAHSDPDLIHSASIRQQGGIRDIADSILVERDGPAQFQYENEDAHILLSVRYIPEFNWFLIVEQDESQALAVARKNMILTLSVGLLASLFIILISVFTVNHFQTRLELMAGTDELTGLANRREFEVRFQHAVHRSSRTEEPFSAILLDIDNLKEINDQFGHIDGDRVIKGVANLLLGAVRGNDTVARWGGDEFIILFEGGLQDAATVAERIRENIFQTKLLSGMGEIVPVVTASMGVTEYREDDDLDSFIHRTDTGLYLSKGNGRNRVSTT